MKHLGAFPSSYVERALSSHYVEGFQKAYRVLTKSLLLYRVGTERASQSLYRSFTKLLETLQSSYRKGALGNPC